MGDCEARAALGGLNDTEAFQEGAGKRGFSGAQRAFEKNAVARIQYRRKRAGGLDELWFSAV